MSASPFYDICFIGSHPLPSKHFQAFAEALTLRGRTVCVLGKEADLAEVVKKSQQASRIVCEEAASPEIWDALAPMTERVFVYYDNPEAWVSSEYNSRVASKLQRARGILFASARLAKEGVFQTPEKKLSFEGKERAAVGFCHSADAESILALRASEEKLQALRADLFADLGMKDTGQRIFVFAGGANTDYYERGFPAFVKALCEVKERYPEAFSNTLVLLQRHPRATDADVEILKQSGLLDGGSVHVSPVKGTNPAVALSDGVFYHQTSMAPQFVKAGVPVAQVGGLPVDDLLMQSGFPCLEEASALAGWLSNVTPVESADAVNQALGHTEEWADSLEKFVATALPGDYLAAEVVERATRI